MRIMATTPPPRAGPNPDGETREAGCQARSRRIEIPQGRRRRVADAARFRPLCGEPLHRSPTGVRAWHHRSGGRGCVPRLRDIASSSRPVRDVRDRPRHCSGSQKDSRSDRPPHHHAETRGLPRQQDLHARPALLCRRAHDRTALLHRRAAGLPFQRPGDDDDDSSLIEDPLGVERVLDLCTGSGCLAILAARAFPNAAIDAVDMSGDAIDVAARNVADYALADRVMLHRGDLFQPLGDKRYDLIISNPPYVDAEGMAELPRECRAEPKLALDGGADGLDIIRRMLHEAGRHLTPEGGLLCEIGRGREMLEAAFPQLPLLWLDTEESEGEVFWIGAADL